MTRESGSNPWCQIATDAYLPIFHTWSWVWPMRTGYLKILPPILMVWLGIDMVSTHPGNMTHQSVVSPYFPLRSNYCATPMEHSLVHTCIYIIYMYIYNYIYVYTYSCIWIILNNSWSPTYIQLSSIIIHTFKCIFIYFISQWLFIFSWPCETGTSCNWGFQAWSPEPSTRSAREQMAASMAIGVIRSWMMAMSYMADWLS